MQRILVIGGLGFLGGRITQYLLSKNYEVVIATSRNLKLKENYLGCKTVKISWQISETIEFAIKGVDYIIHTRGANARDCENDPELALKINALEVVALTQAVRKADRVKKIVYFSTAHVYKNPLCGIIDESTLTNNLHPYATSHRAGEDIILLEGEKRAITSIVLRLSNAFGSPINPENNCWSLLVNDLCRQSVEKGTLTLNSNGEEERDFISISAVNSALSFFLDNNCDSGIFNLGSGKSISVLEMAKVIQNRVDNVLGFMPNLKLNGDVNKVTMNKSLEYRIDKLEFVGHKMVEMRNSEIDELLKFCEINFKRKNE